LNGNYPRFLFAPALIHRVLLCLVWKNSSIHKQSGRGSNESRGKIVRTEYKLASGLQVFERYSVSSRPVTVKLPLLLSFGREKRPPSLEKCDMQTTTLSLSKPAGGQISLSTATGIAFSWRPVGLRLPVAQAILWRTRFRLSWNCYGRARLYGFEVGV
jgi:hypothetical protein